MADTPIPQQQGLSEEELNNMKPVEQKFHEVGDTTINPQLSLKAQRTNLKNLILKNLIDFDKARTAASPTDKYASDSVLESFANNLTETICKAISGQSWNVTTTVTTDVTTDGWNGETQGTATNVIAPTCIKNE